MKHNNNIVVLTLATVAIYFCMNATAVAAISFYFGTGGNAAGGIAKALCSIAGWFQGGVGQAIASLAIIFLGISAFFGKVTWGTALIFACGVFAIFGSADIVKAIVAGTSNAAGWTAWINGNSWGLSYVQSSNCGAF